MMLPETTNMRIPNVAGRIEFFCCARTRRDPEVAARITTLLEGEVDWDYLLRTAGRHGMIPLPCWHLDHACPEAVPEVYMTELRGHFRSNNLGNLLLSGELLKLYGLFEQNGISAIPNKGPTLAASVYGNLSLRQAGDLDILVGRRDVLRARSCYCL